MKNITNSWRQDFPIFAEKNRGKPLVFLDSAASAQKPQVVIDRLTKAYTQEYANVHRGTYELSERLSALYENARVRVQTFLSAKFPEEIIFTKGTTESINLVAAGVAQNLKAGDEIIVSLMEHHSNFVPWQRICTEKGAQLRVANLTADGQIDVAHFESLLSERTKIVAISHASNVLGVFNPVEKIIALAHKNETPVLLDGAQAIAHAPVDVQQLDCDFYAFSSHKLYGPTGVGVLYGKKTVLEKLPPYQTGGGMVKTVDLEKTTYADLPAKFEAGTPPMVEAIGLMSAIDYVRHIGWDVLLKHEQDLTQHMLDGLTALPDVHLLGGVKHRFGVFAFTLGKLQSYDVGLLLDAEGIAVRTGHHCTMPLHTALGISSSVRASLGLYNTAEDVDYFLGVLKKIIFRFSKRNS